MKSGTYVPILDVEVTAWPFPDQYGDGDEVLDDNNNPVTDQGGNVVKSYEPPDGFEDIHDNGQLVLLDKRKNPVRDSNGEAITLEEGGAIAKLPDGSYKTIAPDEVSSFARSMRLKEEPATPAAPSTPETPQTPETPTTPEQTSTDDSSGSTGSADSGNDSTTPTS